MKRLNKSHFTKVIVLISLILSIHSFAFAIGGSDAGGGGSFVQSSKSHQLTFWDLYVSEPEIIDNSPGDRIKIAENENSSYPGIWIDYRQLKSFLFLKERLRQWQPRARKLVNIITDNGIMLRGVESENADSQGFFYLLLGTPLTINNIYEISVPKNYPINSINVFSGAFFDSNTERILLNLNIWNLAGLKSQAACLLHERMRNIQLDFNLTNEEVQKIVYNIISKDPREVSEKDYDDNLFSPLNFKPSKKFLSFPKWISNELAQLFGYDIPLVGRFFYKENALSKAHELDSAFKCKQKNLNPGQPLYEANPYSIICPSLDTTEKEIKSAVDSGILTYQKLNPMKLKSNGKWNKEYNREPLPLTPISSVLLNSDNCKDVLLQHKDPTYFNSYRYPLNCQQGKLDGTGMLYFETFFQDIFEIEIRADLSVNYDAGSEIVVDVMGNEIRLYHNSLPVGFHKGFHNFVFRYDFNKEQISVISNDNGLYKTNPLILQLSFKNKVIKTSRIDFMFGIHNHSTIESVRLLDTTNR